MSLIPNKKNKKDTRPGGGGQQAGKPGSFGSQQKVKTNTKAVNRNTRLTGGTNRGA